MIYLCVEKHGIRPDYILYTLFVSDGACFTTCPCRRIRKVWVTSLHKVETLVSIRYRLQLELNSLFAATISSTYESPYCFSKIHVEKAREALGYSNPSLSGTPKKFSWIRHTVVTTWVGKRNHRGILCQRGVSA